MHSSAIDNNPGLLKCIYEFDQEHLNQEVFREDKMKSRTLEEKYRLLCVTKSSINEHLPTLRSYAKKVSHVTEFGVRAGISTIGLLSGAPKKMISYDINPFKYEHDYVEWAQEIGTEFIFKRGDTREIDIEKTDLLFIDTNHFYDHLMTELTRHCPQVSSYLICHDTVVFANRGMMKAIVDFLKDYREWILEKHHTNNNGLTILRRKNSR